jgi:mitochondrial chaperone BCS1
MSLSVLQNTIQFDLVNRLRTNNPFYDAIISSLIFSAGAYGLQRFSEIFGQWKHKIIAVAVRVSYLLTRLIKRQKEKINKTVVIDYLTDNKQINELYKAVQYFLSNDSCIDYTKESPLKLTYEKKIQTLQQLEDLSLNKYIPQYQEKTFFYKGYEVKYTGSKETVSIYTDKERKRENYTITLSTMISSDTKVDILNDFCHHCMTEYIKSQLTQKWCQQVFVNKDGKWNSQPSNNKRKVDTVILKNGLKHEIMDDLQLFLQSEDWYNCRDIPYTRGYLFYGSPGTGKTSMIKGISTFCRRHIHYMMLNDIKDDHELIELMKQINYRETILVIEDIDCTIDAIKNRKSQPQTNENKEHFDKLIDKIDHLEYQIGGRQRSDPPKTNLTLSGLLNSIDGIFNNDGRILIMTTNHPEVLDEALIRPGRIDCKYLFENCDKKQISDLYNVFFNQKCNEQVLASVENNEFSPAYIAGLFLRYRNKPEEALHHLNKTEDQPIIEPMIQHTVSTNTTNTTNTTKTQNPVMITWPSFTETQNPIADIESPFTFVRDTNIRVSRVDNEDPRLT